MTHQTRKLGRNVCILVMLACAVASCKFSRGGISYTEIKRDQTVHLVADDKSSPNCHVGICLTVLESSSDNPIVKSINDSIVSAAFNYTGLTPEAAVDSFCSHYVNMYRSDLLTLYRDDDKKHEVGPWFEYNYDLKSEYAITHDSILNYTLSLDVFEGGAHGSHVQTYLNFNLNNGKPYTLNNILIPGYEAPVTELLLKKLMKQHDVTTEKELNDLGYLTFGTPLYIPENYLIHDNKVEFYYNQYEIAPYALGTTTLELTYDELKPYLMKIR